jgi:CTP:molybdopterin cytidylyltransferase MocA
MRAARSNELVVAGVLLAAGAGRRYGKPKALVAYGDQLLVERGLATLRAAGCDPIIIVLGAAAEEVQARAHLTGGRVGRDGGEDTVGRDGGEDTAGRDGGEVTVIVNENWPTGMGSSLRCALTTLADTTAGAALVLLVDTPGVTAGAIARIVEHAGPTALVTATYGGRRGHPVLLGRSHWAGIAELARGDVGARPYLVDHADQVVEVPCDDISDGADLDFPTDTNAQ